MRRYRSERTFVLLLGLAPLLVLAWAAGERERRSGGLVRIGEALDRPGMLVVAAVLLIVAPLFRPDGRHRRPLSLLLIAAGALAVPVTLLFCLLGAAFGSGGDRVERHAAPGRGDRTLVVDEGAAGPDSIWSVQADEGTGLSTRRWELGSFGRQTTHPAGVRLTAAWTGPDEITVETDEGVYVFHLDPRTGEPTEGAPVSRAAAS
ncbi:hypothetical protein [Kitasatospora sp. NPDC057223]|uniref:hypothetical protein n=1 Tax=Kitasatospora sp. NPDC057223 TaxID=3346055 RepID=UPI00363596E8